MTHLINGVDTFGINLLTPSQLVPLLTGDNAPFSNVTLGHSLALMLETNPGQLPSKKYKDLFDSL